MENAELEKQQSVVDTQTMQCEELLRKHAIDTSSWGSGDSKALSQLAIELIQGECRLELVEYELGKSTLARRLSVVEANVFYTSDNGPTMLLRETAQEFSDGRSRTRPHMTASIAEKMRINENPDEAILRGINEELGFATDRWQIELTDAYKKEQQSQSYPGLLNVMRLYQFDAHLTRQQFDPHGYTEVQTSKTSRFSWKKLDKEPRS